MEKENVNEDRFPLVTAWFTTLIASSLLIIFWRELFTIEPYWWPWLHAILLVALFICTLVVQELKPLRRFSFIFILIFFLGFGGGWDFGLVPYIISTDLWNQWFTTGPFVLTQLSLHLLRLTPAIAVLMFLLASGRKKEDMYLIKGQIDAPVEPTRLLGMKKEEPWTKIGGIFAVVITIITFVIMLGSTPLTIDQLITGLPLIPLALLIAAINAFNEEFTLRAAPLSEAEPVLGKPQALAMTSLYFGLGHYLRGTPSGIFGVILSTFLGYLIGKSMLETKGFFWAWFLHFLPDIFIFTFIIISSI